MSANNDGPELSGSLPPASAPRAPDLAGITAGRFLGNTKTSGRDGVTSVWLGLDERTGARVVIRVVPGAAELAVRGLSDENLVTTVGVYQLGPERHAHVAEHHQPGSLENLVQAQGRLTAQQTLRVLIAVSSGLAEIHAAGLAHGAVGPGHVLLNAQGRPLLGGLESVRAASQPSAEAQTPSDTASMGGPKPVTANPPATKTRDVAAVGELGWFALTGRAAPAGGVLTGLSDLAPHVPAALVGVILDCQPSSADGPAAGGLDAPGSAKSQPTAAAIAARLRAMGVGDNIELPLPDGPQATNTLLAAGSRAEGSRAVDGNVGSSLRSPEKVAAMAAAVVRARPRHPNTPWRAHLAQGAAVTIVASVLAVGGWAIATADNAPPASPVAASFADPTPTGRSSEAPTPTTTAPATTTLSSSTPSSTLASASTGGGSLLDTTQSADPVQALHALNELRVQALSTEDATLLAAVNAPDSPALRHDQAVLGQLADEQIDVRGLGVRLLWTTVLDETDDAARIQVSSQVEKHRQIAASGASTSAVTHGVDAGETRTLTMELVRLAGQWRIYAVREPGSIPTSGPFAAHSPTATTTP